MRAHFIRLCTAATLLVLPAGALTAAEQVGVSAAVRGTVQIRSAEKQRLAAAGENVFLGDRVSSKAQSGMQILLLDETTFTVGADCDLTIDEFVYAPGGGSAVSATVGKGALRYVSGLIAKDSPDHVKLKTPASTIGLRGTSAETVVGADAIKLAKLLGIDVSKADPKTATLVVLRGPGSDRTTTDNRGRAHVGNGLGSVDLERAGFAAFIGGSNQPPEGPFRMSDEAEQFLQKLLAQKAQAKAGGSGGLNTGSGVVGSGQTWVEGKPFDQQHDANGRGFGDGGDMTPPPMPCVRLRGGASSFTSYGGDGCYD